MNLRYTLMLGIATTGLMLALPSHADSWRVDDAAMIAQRNVDDGARRGRQEQDRDERRPSWRDAERDDPQGFGYGYERRQRESGGYESAPQDRRGNRGSNGNRR
jgi:hypothetical protein